MPVDHVIFVSYAHDDDNYDGGGITKLAERLERSIQAFTGQKDLRVFFDRKAIDWGDVWRSRVTDGLTTSAILIAIVTPSYLVSRECQRELAEFLSSSDSGAWLLPIYYLEVHDLDERDDPLCGAIREHQYEDWRELRMVTPSSLKVRKAIENLAARIRDLLNDANGADAGRPVTERTLDYRAHRLQDTDDADWFDYAMEARALSDIDEYGLARAVLAEALSRFPEAVDLIYELAIVNWYEGYLADAVECFEAALDVGLDRLDVLQGLGQVHIELGDFERGVAELTEVVNDYHDSASAAYARSARALGIGMMGDLDRARAELDAAEQLTPRNAWLHFNRGLLLEAQGDARAIDCYIRSLIHKDPPLNRPKRIAAQQRLDGLDWAR